MTCPLCDAVDQTYRLISSNDHVFSIVCKWPLKPGHVLVIPRRHVTSLGELSSAESKSLMDEVARLQRIIYHSYNVHPIVVQHTGSHGSQEHIHLHVLPSKGNLRLMLSQYEGLPERADANADEMSAYRDVLLSSAQKLGI